jgi:hypothetical protein
MDTRDIFFQAHPFASLPSPEETKEDLLFIEEIAPHTNPKPDDPKRSFVIGNSFYVGRTEHCYGKEHFADYFNRPILCSGTIIGTRNGMHRMLSVLVSEFYANNAKTVVKCRSPHTTGTSKVVVSRLHCLERMSLTRQPFYQKTNGL